MADTVKMQITLPAAAAEKLAALCNASGVSKSAMIALIIAEKFEQKGEAQK